MSSNSGPENESDVEKTALIQLNHDLHEPVPYTGNGSTIVIRNRLDALNEEV